MFFILLSPTKCQNHLLWYTMIFGDLLRFKTLLEKNDLLLLLIITRVHVEYTSGRRNMMLYKFFKIFILWSKISFKQKYKFLILIMESNILIQYLGSIWQKMRLYNKVHALRPHNRMELLSIKIVIFLRLLVLSCFQWMFWNNSGVMFFL